MGASGWDYCVPYQADLAQALRDLREQVFERGEFAWHGEWQPERDVLPATLEQLWQDEQVQESGTHSILDVDRIIDPHDGDSMMAVRPLTEEEVQGWIGGAKPTRADFERAGQNGGLFDLVEDRWSACCMVLYAEDGEPTEIAFWGISGD